MHTPRQPDHPIEPMFFERWSPRAFDGSEVEVDELHTLLEAARWAPSAFNAQPWRFRYARRDTEWWQPFLSGLLPFNQNWAHTSSVLIYVLSDTLGPAKAGSEPALSYSHSFDAGSAWMLLALQARRHGLYTHAMSGIDLAAARSVLGAPERFRIEAAIALGRLGDKSQLPEALQAREVPSDRKPLDEIACEGGGCF